MSKLACHSVVTDNQLPVSKNTGSHTFSDRNQHRIPNSVHAREG